MGAAPIERVVVTHLIKEKGKIAGAAGFSLDELKVHTFKAKSIILCTGAGGFKPNGFPICDLTHDGTIMAYNIGAKVTGKEWKRKIKPKADLTGQRDLTDPDWVEIQGQAKGEDTDPPWESPPKWGEHRLGWGEHLWADLLQACRSTSQKGGVPINEKCESNIPGLYAAGDALGSYMSGAIYTQIGSSLAGSAMQGAVAAKAAAQYCQAVEMPKISAAILEKVQEEMLAPLRRASGYSPSWVTQTLQGIMIPNFVLYVKKENLLKAALAYIEELRDHHMPLLRAADLHELRLAHETANMILSAEMKLRASIMRKESRCSHFRLDYPEPDYESWNAWINIYKGKDGNMKLEKQSFNSWPS